MESSVIPSILHACRDLVSFTFAPLASLSISPPSEITEFDLPNLTKLTVHGRYGHILFSPIWEMLRVPNIRELRLGYVHMHHSRIFPLESFFAHSCKALARLDLRIESVDDLACDILSHLEALASLSLSNSVVKDQFFERISQPTHSGQIILPNLTRLSLVDCLFPQRGPAGNSLLLFLTLRQNQSEEHMPLSARPLGIAVLEITASNIFDDEVLEQIEAMYPDSVH